MALNMNNNNVNDEWLLDEMTTNNQTKPEGWGSFIAEHIGGPVASATSAVLGMPGNIENLLTKGVQAVTGWESPQVPTMLGNIETPGENALGPNFFPTSEDIQNKIFKPLLGSSIEPKSEKQKTINSVVGDIAAFIPSMGLNSAAKVVGLGHLVGKGVQYLGGETAGDVAKSAIYLGSAFPGFIDNFKNITKDLYNKSRSLLNLDSTMSANRLNKILNQTKNFANKSVMTGSDILKDVVNTVKTNISQSKINVKDLINRKQEINNLIEQYGSNPKYKFLTAQLKKLNSEINHEIGLYSNQNKEFGSIWNEAEKRFAAQSERSRVGEKLTKWINIDKLEHPITKILLGGLLVHGGPAAVGKLAFGMGSAKLLEQGVRVIDLLLNSPQAAQRFFKIIAATAKNDRKLTENLVKGLDKYLIKNDEDDQWVLD